LDFRSYRQRRSGYYGGVRKGDNKWANSVVALRASTGDLFGAFSRAHDLGLRCRLAAHVVHLERRIPAVVITRRWGMFFVLHRLNRSALGANRGAPVPKSDIPGEDASPTQPFSTISLVPGRGSADDAWGPTPDDLKWCQDQNQVVARARDVHSAQPGSTAVFRQRR